MFTGPPGEKCGAAEGGEPDDGWGEAATWEAAPAPPSPDYAKNPLAAIATPARAKAMPPYQ